MVNSPVATKSQTNSSPARTLTRRFLLKELAARGVRTTAQRRVLVELIQQAAEHLDAAKLLRLARQQDSTINRATVYRTLALLKKLALIDELDLMHLEGEKHYFEAKTNRDHCHLTCVRCGSVVEYTSPAFEALKDEIGRNSGFRILAIRLEVGGYCARCCKKTQGTRKQRERTTTQLVA